MTIQKIQYKQELGKYISFIYISLILAVMIFGGLYDSIQNKNLVESIICGFLSLSWIYIIIFSINNIIKICNSIFKKETSTTIKPVTIVDITTGKSINKREFKWLLIFVTLCYSTVILMTIIENT